MVVEHDRRLRPHAFVPHHRKTEFGRPASLLAEQDFVIVIQHAGPMCEEKLLNTGGTPTLQWSVPELVALGVSRIGLRPQAAGDGKALLLAEVLQILRSS